MADRLDLDLELVGRCVTRVASPGGPLYGIVGWINQLNDDAVDVTFDDPTHVVAPSALFCTVFNQILFDDGRRAATVKQAARTTAS